MKVIIDIPEENYDNKTLVDYFGCYSKMLDATIYNGTLIPDNATVCDIEQIRAEIKALPYAEDTEIIHGILEDTIGKERVLEIIDKYTKY